MRVFIDYCIENPILTIILIISAVAMLVMSGIILALPNTDEQQKQEEKCEEKSNATAEIAIK